MNIPELAIRRWALALMLNAVLVLFGIIAANRMGIDRLPYIEFPMVSVATRLPGGNPEIIDTSITNIIESSVNSVPGIEHVQSSSSPGVSVVTIVFDLSKKIDIGFTEVQAKVNQVLARLPDDADPPVVAKVEAGASPVMWLSLRGDRTQQQLNVYASNVLKKKLETIDGVGEVRLGGRRDRVIRVHVDPLRMAALNVTAQDLRSAFQREHVQFPGGFMVRQQSELLVKVDLEYHKPQELGNIIVAYRDGAPLLLRDFATIEDELEDFRQNARLNGGRTIGLGLVKIANSNTVAIVDEALRRLREEIEPQLPAGMTLTVSGDESVFVREMVQALRTHLVEGSLLAAAVVFLFLRSIRSTLIIATAIPISLLGSVAVMYFFGFTFNNMTLLALLLLIGVVVDDAIVVLENVFRHREELGMDRTEAAVRGSTQVFFAVTAASLSLVSIFVPVIFMGGMIGRFFDSFAVVVTFGVLTSLFVSITLTPMLCARFLSVPKQHGRLYHVFDGFFSGLNRGYRVLLAQSLRHRWAVLGISLALVASSGLFFMQIGKAFFPVQDEGQFIVNVRTPLGSNIHYTDRKLREVEAILAGQPQVLTYFTAIGFGQAGRVNQAFAFVRLKPRDQRAVSQQELLETLRGQFGTISGAHVFASPLALVGGQRGEQLQFVVTGLNINQVARSAYDLRAALVQEQGLGALDLTLQLDMPQLLLEVDRVRAASLGISSSEIAQAVDMLTGGSNIARFNDLPGDGQRYDIRVKAPEGTFNSPADLSQIHLRAPGGEMVRLDTVASFRQVVGPAVIDRFDLQYAANFFSSPSIPLGAAVDTVRRVAAERLPPGVSVQFIGQSKEFSRTAGYMRFAFITALILLYMVLSSQFNSLVQPLVIMVAQPLAVVGGVFALWATGNTLNIFSMIGLVLLLGLVAKNSILLVDLTNQLRAEGRSIPEALLEACPIRLRPVLMTSLTIIMALLPAAIGVGAGAETTRPLAIAVIGGMVSSTLLTLVVVPAAYSLVENAMARFEAARANHDGTALPVK